MKEKYDICVVSFSDVRFDGRTKNLIDSLIKLNKKIIVFSLTPNNFFNLQVKHISVFVPKNSRTFIRWINFVVTVKKNIKKIDYDTYYACDLYSLICGNKKLIYDSREIYSALSTLYNSSFRQKVLSFIEKYYIKYVTILITSGTRDTKYLKDKYKLEIPSYEIYNYPKNKEYITSNIIREKLNIEKDKTILLYQGVILNGRGLKPIIEAISEDENYVLVILGEGSYKNILLDYAKKNRVNNRIYFVGNINYDDLHLWTCSADIGLCNIEPISFSYQLALPNKLFEYILAELPILVTNLPALADIINEHNIGKIIAEDNNKIAILTALADLKQNKIQFKSNIRKIKNNYTYENQFNLIKNII